MRSNPGAMWASTGGQAEVKTRQDKTRQRLLEAISKQRSRGQDQSLAWKMEREKQPRSNVGCYRRPSRGQDKTIQDKGYWRPSRGQEVRTSHWPGRWRMRSNPAGAMWAATGGQAEVKTRQRLLEAKTKVYWSGPVTGLEDGA